MKILITNTVMLNGGDAAILLSILNILRNNFGQDTEFVIRDSDPEVAARYYPELVLKKQIYLRVSQIVNDRYGSNKYLRYLLKLIAFTRFYCAAWFWGNGFPFIAKFILNEEELLELKEYSSAELVVSTGGTYLVENYPLTLRIFDFRICQFLRRPLILYTQSLGPFGNSSNQRPLKDIFNKAILILLRDQKSFEHIQNLDLSGRNAHVSSDIVFSFTSEQVIRNARYRTLNANRQIRIGISVRYWPYFKLKTEEEGMQSYLDTLRSLVIFFVQEYGAEITFISTCQGIPEYKYNDAEVAGKLFESLPGKIKPNVHVDNDFHHPKELVEVLKTYDLLIATRMHMCILGLVAGTPVIPIAYEFKTKELFKRLDLEKFVQDIEYLEPVTCISVVRDFIDHLPDLRPLIFEKVFEEYTSALESGQIVKQSFENYLSMKQ